MTDQERQRLILVLTRKRQHYVQTVDEKEEADKHASYERGIAYGLSLALNEIQSSEDRAA